MKLRFEWDNKKAAANRRKHRVGFDEASTVFDDALARIFDDVEHSTDEIREIIIELQYLSGCWWFLSLRYGGKIFEL